MKPVKAGLYGCGARTNALVDNVYKDNLVEVACCYDTAEERRADHGFRRGRRNSEA